MPVPLRPVRQTEKNIPSFMDPSSSLQHALLGGSAQQIIRLQPINKVDIRDSEMLHRIWLANDLRLASKGDRSYRVPDDITDYDVIRLKTAGYIVGKGRDIEFTEQGDKIVKKKILEAASEFDLERTREKHDPKAVLRKNRG